MRWSDWVDGAEKTTCSLIPSKQRRWLWISEGRRQKASNLCTLMDSMWIWVAVFHFLGIQIEEDLSWNAPVTTKKAQQRLYFLWILKKNHQRVYWLTVCAYVCVVCQLPGRSTTAGHHQCTEDCWLLPPCTGQTVQCKMSQKGLKHTRGTHHIQDALNFCSQAHTFYPKAIIALNSCFQFRGTLYNDNKVYSILFLNLPQGNFGSRGCWLWSHYS